MKGRLLGGILLVVGTSVGAGMLALPLVLHQLGLLFSIILLGSAWFFMTIASVFLLKVNVTLPRRTHMVSMARQTLGRFGEVVTWISYLLLLYCLLAAYVAAGADLVSNLGSLMHAHVMRCIAVILFVSFFGTIVFCGVRLVDLFNRGLMTIKFTAFIILISLLFHHVSHGVLFEVTSWHLSKLPSAVLVVITSFGFAVIVPSLRDFFDGDASLMLKSIIWGSIITLMCYLAWVTIVLGIVPTSQPINQLSGLIKLLIHTTSSPLTINAVHLFTYICITTSFLGVSLALMDFLADGFSLKSSGMDRWVNLALTFIPPVAVVIFVPHLFVLGLSLGGVFCVILLMLLPALMLFKIPSKLHSLAWIELLGILAVVAVGCYWLFSVRI